MDYDKFRKILTTFSDPGTEVELARGNLLVQINDRALTARVRVQNGEVYVEDDSSESMPATEWIILRVARLLLLADRILQFIPQTDHFVRPEAAIFDNLDDEHPRENEHATDALETSINLLARRFAYTSSVVYLTSDAGEGKTTLIQEMARHQANAYKNRTTDWLLVPIELGGRPFIRFDDMIAGYLTNRLRFPLFYYDAFIELVKLGVIVPAFDGFEETLVVNASGDAYSAIGSLMASLEQQGTVLISARKAFFEYQELKLQARLYDSIGKNSVGFSRIQLCRWKRPQFLYYARSRGYADPEGLFQAVSSALHSDEHALLTRAVLANRLLTVAASARDLAGLLRNIGSSADQYFPVFVDAIIEREVNEKWLDSAGEAAQPLLSVQEHRDLLGMIAQEMWIQSTDALKADILELIANLFCEAHKKTSAVTQQIQQRIKQHALLVPSDGVRNQFGFDHEEFRHYFLGLTIAQLLLGADPHRNSDLASLLRRRALPSQVLDSISCEYKNVVPTKASLTIEVLRQLSKFDAPTSYLHENCAQLVLRLLSNREIGAQTLEILTFGPESLQTVSFTNITFKRCAFHSTGISSSAFLRCRFVECRFDRLNLNSQPAPVVSETVFEDCEFGSIVPVGKESAVFNPEAFPLALRKIGFGVQSSTLLITTSEPSEYSEDEDFALIVKLLRCLNTRTHISDVFVKTKFGKQSGPIIDEVLPKLVANGVLYEDTYRGGGRQHIFKLVIGMQRLHELLERSQGSSSRFYALLGG
jgi:hypothetical protein